jgi:D-glycero-D-manno-heptose 1,7-bisphosphate phosphatase
MNRAVFLDRDGVINRNEVRDGRPVGPETLAQFVILRGVREAVEAFAAAGFLVIVATNQPNAPRDVVEAMHALLRKTLKVDDIKVCIHAEADNCACRKPKPGLLLEAAREREISLSQSWMIGDRWRDIDAGKAAGCRTVLVEYDYPNERRPRDPDIIVHSLIEAVPFVTGGKAA